MTKNILQSERQRPRAVEFMKEAYTQQRTQHMADPNWCDFSVETCPMMVDLKKRIEAEEALLAGAPARFFGLK